MMRTKYLQYPIKILANLSVARQSEPSPQSGKQPSKGHKPYATKMHREKRRIQSA